GKHVIEVAQARDRVARSILADAGRELGRAAVAVIRNLKMERERFQVAYVGGVFAGEALVLDPLAESIHAIAPRAFLAPPLFAPAVAAARMALENGRHVALAV